MEVTSPLRYTAVVSAGTGRSLKEGIMGLTARSLDEALVRPFEAALRGGLLRPGDLSYDAARSIWNATIDRRPALIARCAGAADVIRAVDFARAKLVEVQPREPILAACAISCRQLCHPS